MPLLRTAIGYAIRTKRLERGENLREVSHRAPIALGYLSEVERGQKDISSELLRAVARGLEIETSELMRYAVEVMSDWEQQEKENACVAVAEL